MPHLSPASIGWDVGGAHVKAARVAGGRVTGVVQLPCPLWLGLERLPGTLAEAMARLGPAPLHAATMTGELADVFPSRAAGVACLTDALARAVGPARLRLYGGAAGFLDPAEAAAHADAVASANWHATAALAGRFVPDALLVDMGSTTTDLVPVTAGHPANQGSTDAERLACGELTYTGLVRTPVMALCRRAPFGGAWVGLANELFATAADVYRVLGELPEDADQMAAADGREKTAEASRARLARMVGHDAEDATPEAWRALAAWLAEAQMRQVVDAAVLVLSRSAIPITPPSGPDLVRPSTTSTRRSDEAVDGWGGTPSRSRDGTRKPGHDGASKRRLPGDAPILGAGIGRHLAARLAARLDRPYRNLAALPPFAPVPGAADCAPAVAVAWLASCPA